MRPSLAVRPERQGCVRPSARPFIRDEMSWRGAALAALTEAIESDPGSLARDTLFGLRDVPITPGTLLFMVSWRGRAWVETYCGIGRFAL